jgi:TolA-binding protein
VAVLAGGMRAIVEAGERWSDEPAADEPADEPANKSADEPANKPADEPANKPAGEPADDEPIEIEIDPDDTPAPNAPRRADPGDDFAAARRLETNDPDAARRAYRALASRRDRWAALALYALAELEASRRRASEALAALDEYERRFPRGTNAEDAAWLRVQVLLNAGRRDDASAAARAYLTRFPDGTYRGPAHRAAGGD